MLPLAITKPTYLWRGVLLYSGAHFVVDFACAFLMFSRIHSSPDWYLCVLIYNFCAFAMQMPVGVLADRLNRNAWLAAAGCALVALSFGASAFPLAAAVTAGTGNAMFHIGGGVDVLNVSSEKSGPLGVFVSPGAFGIYFGTMLGKSDGLPVLAVLITLLAASGLILSMRRFMRCGFPRNTDFSLDTGLSRGMGGATVCLFLVVCLRSWVGTTLGFPWKSMALWSLALICATVCGKAAGGFLADRIGAVRASFLSLGLASVLFIFSNLPLAGVLAVLLFNMTMPVTLWAMARIFPGAKGFSFGLLTFGLFLGFLPSYLGVSMGAFMGWPFAVTSAVSLLLIRAGLGKATP